jgi:hypothetical protein
MRAACRSGGTTQRRQVLPTAAHQRAARAVVRPPAVGGSPPAPASGESVSPVGAAAGLVEGGNVKLHGAARIGDLAAVEARPPASLGR